MKRKFLLVSFLLATASGAVTHAQQGGDVGVGILWRRYTVKDEEFSVILPTLPAMATSKVARKSDNKIRLEKRLFTASDGVYYRITAFENPKPKQSLEQLIDELGLTGEFEFDPASKRRLSKDGFKGIEYSATEKSPTAIVQFFATENHLYRFIAARQIKFTPALKNGKPVSMWMQLEYNFNL